MSQRIVIGLDAGADSAGVAAALKAAGADSVTGPTRELPDVLVGVVPSDRDVAAVLERARKLAGVRYAEMDAWRTT